MFSTLWQRHPQHQGSRISSRSSRFDQIYRCYPASTSGKPHLEDGDKVILPASALNTLAALRIEYPMQFELQSPSNGGGDQAAPPRASHCGVLEFVAEEGAVVMPEWMMKNMALREGDLMRVRSAALPKGTYVRLRPHTSEFLEITNPKAVLEKTLRTFSCFTTGDTIMVSYNHRKYYIDIVETKPASAVSIVETDCEVDFAPPLDYKEPEKPQQQQPSVNVPAASKNKATAGGGEGGGEGDSVVKDGAELFKPFTGSGKRLDGKEASKVQQALLPEAVASSTDARSAPPSDPNGGRGKRQQTSAAPTGASGAASSSSSRQKTGKLVFGGSSTSSSKEAQKAAVKQQAEEPPKKEEPKFQAFTGKSYSLQR